MSIFRQAFLALLVSLLPTSVLAEADQRPNIVVFITDDQSQLDCSAYGATDVRTPNMQRLAQSGMTFDRAFVASPSCAPSRAALLTGLMPARNGAEPNHSRPRPDIKKWPAYFQELGYEVVAFGKVAHYKQAELYGFDQHAAGQWLAKGNMKAAKEYFNAYTGEKPVCFLFGTHQPHVPWPKKTTYQDDSVTLRPTHVDTPTTRRFRAQYYTSVSRADRMLGTVYDLAREKLGDDTLFVFTSDHGAQWPFGKWNLYEEGVRVPLIVSWPGRVKAGVRTDAMVSWVDLLPTLVELAGGKAPESPEQVDGRSFAGVLRGEADSHRDEIYTTHSGDGNFNVYPMRAVRDGRWKLVLNLHPEFAYATHINRAGNVDGAGYWATWLEAAKRDERAASIVSRYRQRPAEELYDLEADPHEQHNLASDPTHANRVKAMRNRVEAWMQSQGDQQKLYGDPTLLESTPAPTR
ncbi:Choline-sulfatase [Posidoniimonas corsicana]|uniref:Choline-sulfatase n=1 Tax=Posidoniimonas corsicana TaxID=1938618 RepID=A0A5C5VDZ6_9BACT|nr:sulfatase [Posidoniimonas corsicana]TWT36177.1 Choline-sulfatase [Posidoniimonas corsicana]